MGEQQIADAKKHGIKQLITMEHCWASFMGRRVFSVCKAALKRPMQLLSIFEKAGKDAEAREQFLEWKVPITKFPVVQYYVEGTPKKIWVKVAQIKLL